MAYDPNCEETKAAVAAAVNDAVTRLKAKNEELIGEIRDLRKNGGADSVAKIEALEAKLDKVNDELAAAKTEARTAKGDATKATGALTAAQKRTNDLLIANGLKDAMGENKIAPQFQKAVEAMFKGQATVKVDGETETILVGDKPLGEALKAFASSDEGKHFVAAANSGGGGAGGGGAKTGGKSLSREAFGGLDSDARAAHIKDGGTVVDT